MTSYVIRPNSTTNNSKEKNQNRKCHDKTKAKIYRPYFTENVGKTSARELNQIRLVFVAEEKSTFNWPHATMTDDLLRFLSLWGSPEMTRRLSRREIFRRYVTLWGCDTPTILPIIRIRFKEIKPFWWQPYPMVGILFYYSFIAWRYKSWVRLSLSSRRIPGVIVMIRIIERIIENFIYFLGKNVWPIFLCCSARR